MLNSFIHNRVASSEGPKSNSQDTFSNSVVCFWSTLLMFILIGTSPGLALLKVAYFILFLSFHGCLPIPFTQIYLFFRHVNIFNQLNIVLPAWVHLCLFEVLLIYYFWPHLLLLILCFIFSPKFLWRLVTHSYNSHDLAANNYKDCMKIFLSWPFLVCNKTNNIFQLLAAEN